MLICSDKKELSQYCFKCKYGGKRKKYKDMERNCKVFKKKVLHCFGVPPSQFREEK